MKIFSEICQALREDGTAVLVTIITSSGSTPAPYQSRMLIRKKGAGEVIGTIGGGCLEANIVSTVTKNSGIEGAHTRIFHLNDDLGETGLSCGGTIEVLVEALRESMLPMFETVASQLKAGNSVLLTTRFDEAGNTVKSVLDLDWNTIAGMPPEEEILRMLRHQSVTDDLAGGAVQLQISTGKLVLEKLEAEPPLVIFGGGHVGKAVSCFASMAGFRVTVVDDRYEFANKTRFPEAEKICCETFETACSQLDLTPATYVVVATRGHREDEYVLEKMLRHDLQYIGMIGSKRKVMLTFRRLTRAGISPEKLAGVHAPIGIPIGARTPEEIGISVVAQLIAMKRGKLRASPDHAGALSAAKVTSEEIQNA